MFRKFALIWAIIILPLAVIMFGCGDDDPIGVGPIGGPDDTVSAEWEITVQTSGFEGADPLKVPHGRSNLPGRL